MHSSSFQPRQPVGPGQRRQRRTLKHNHFLATSGPGPLRDRGLNIGNPRFGSDARGEEPNVGEADCDLPTGTVSFASRVGAEPLVNGGQLTCNPAHIESPFQEFWQRKCGECPATLGFPNIGNRFAAALSRLLLASLSALVPGLTPVLVPTLPVKAAR